MTAPPKTDPRTCLGLAALVLLLFRPWTAAGLPFFGSDLALFFYPLLTAVRDALASGHFPWWTERVFAGMPLAADPQASVFYPPAWLLFTGPFERLTGAYLAAHLLLLGVGASVAFARLGASRLGAFLGGAAFMLGTTVPSRLAAGHLTYLQAAAWVPWAYAALLGHLATGERRRLASTAAFLSLSLLGGFPQITFYGILWLLWTALTAPRPGVPSLPRAAGGTLLAVALAFGLAGAMLVPGWEMSRLSVRVAGLSDAFRLSDSLPPRQLATLLLPGLFGDRPAAYWAGEAYRWWEYTAFNGILPWLAVPALGWAVARRPGFLHLLVPVPLTLLLALGSNTPIYPLVMRLPGFSLFRLPAQIIFLTAVALAGLTALAATALQQVRRPSRRMVATPLALGLILAAGAAWALRSGGAHPSIPAALATAAASCLLIAAGFALVASGRRTTGTCLVAAAVAAELLVAARPAVAYLPQEPFARLGGIVAATGPLAEPYRILPLRPAEGGPSPFGANETMRTGGEAITGYNPLLPAGTARLLSLMTGRGWPSSAINYPPPSEPFPPVTDLLNCRVIVTSSPTGPAGGGFAELPWKAADPRWRFLLNDRALGRATVYPSATRVPDRALGERLLRIDPRRELLVDARLALPDVATPRPVRPALLLPRGASGAVVFDREGSGGYLLVSQGWHPGWTASWRGGPLPVLPADIGLTLVPLPVGCRRVELAYRPASHRAGLALSAASLLGVGLLAFGRGRRRGR